VQVGTVIGFVLGTVLVAIWGARQELYWIALPCVIFGAAYASTAIGIIAGQASFTVFAVVLFSILSPEQGLVGFTRVENIAIGGLLCLFVASMQLLGQRMFAPKTGVDQSVKEIVDCDG
jgi:hypothetical protein